MSAATKIFEPRIFQQRALDEEHSEVEWRYMTLEAEILTGRGMSAMVDAAESLVRAILLHLNHEKEFLEPISRAILLKQVEANRELTSRLLDIEEGLKQEKPAAVLQLLLLVKRWLYWHMWTDSIEFECLAPVPAKVRNIGA
jgi:hemerythrin